MKHRLMLPASALAILFLAACGSSGVGDLGDILGGSSSAARGEIRGTVDYVDTSARAVVLTNVSTQTNLRNGSTTGQQVRVYYDDRTDVRWQGNLYRPTDLERGDEVAVAVEQVGDRLHAESMTVLYNASGGGTGTPSASTIRGTVNYVDTSRRTIQVDRGTYGGMTTIAYATNTPVDYQGRTYSPADLERGDEIEIWTRSSGGQIVADRITVIRDARSGAGTAGRVLRGTVQYVDTSRRTLELSQPTWVNRFDTGGGTLGGTTVLEWDANTRVEYQGQLYAPTNLERGDVVEVTVTDLGGNRFRADRIVVVRNVRN